MAERRPRKIEDVLGLARRCIEEDRWRDSRHGAERRAKRDVTVQEMRQVVMGGWREESRDEFRREYQSWSYVVRGKTVDGRSLRIVFSFDEKTWMLIITAVDLDR